jgi:hypothetical protein
MISVVDAPIFHALELFHPSFGWKWTSNGDAHRFVLSMTVAVRAIAIALHAIYHEAL